MATYHRWEDFPQRTISYLAGRPNADAIMIRILSTERIMLTEITVKGGGTIPRHRHHRPDLRRFPRIQSSRPHPRDGRLLL